MSDFIPYGRQDVSKVDIQAVVDVLQSDFLTQGPAVPAFEKAVSCYCCSDYAVAVNSATSALHIACLALGLGKGDWLWTSPNTFVASANCALYCGAKVDFVDVDPQTYNMSVDALRQKLEKAAVAGKLPKIVVPVHFAGQSCDMHGIKLLADRYGFKIIEDAAHAIGGRYLDEPVGNCRFSDITVFSFHPVKIITSGEGGMALTNNLELGNRMVSLRSHGITRDPMKMTHESAGGWYYQQIELGFNYRMTDIQAALGLSQFKRLDVFVQKRHVIASAYDKLLQDLPVVIPWQHSDVYSAYHLYPVCVNADIRMNVFDCLRVNNVGVNVHYIPIHLQPYYQGLNYDFGTLSVAENYYECAISLPLYPAISTDAQMHVVNCLRHELKL